MFEMYDIKEGLSDERIDKMELKFKVTLPPSYRAFLKEFHGGRPIPKDFKFFDGEPGSTVDSFLCDTRGSDSNSFAWALIVLKGRYPKKDFFPIASDVFGNYIFLGVSERYFDHVYFWDHELEHDPDQGEKCSMNNMTKIAESFEAFKNALTEVDYDSE